MNYRLIIAFLFAIGTALFAVVLIFNDKTPAAGVQLLEGDIVMQSSPAPGDRWIEQATRSPYSRIGLVELHDGLPWVIEVSDKVSRMPWIYWRERGRDRKLVILRLPSLSDADRHSVAVVAEGFMTRPADPKMEWTDDRLYGAELVEKAYDRGAHITLGQMEALGDLRLDGLEDTLAAIWGPTIPRDQEIVTPSGIARDPRLVIVWTSFGGGDSR